MQTNSHALELRSITHRFGQTIAANDISLATEPGELISLLGPSGCGKTTLLRIVAGFIRQSGGDVLVDNASISGLSVSQRQVGIVFQNYALFPHMTVADNVAYGLRARGRGAAEVAKVVTEMLSLVQMERFTKRLPRELSGGQQQRVALARCLAIQPRILLLDEPFSALDKNLRLDMQIEIKQLVRNAGITTILVTHDQEEALSMSDRIAVLANGNLEQFATPNEIYDRPASLFVNQFVGTTNLLKGSIVENRDGVVTARIGNEGVVTAPGSSRFSGGDRALVSIRPENLVVAAADAAGAIQARITAIMPIGATNIYEASLTDGQSIKFMRAREVGTADEQAPGSQVFLAIRNADAVNLFAEPH